MSLKQVAIAIDQLLNALLGGMADETLSARAHCTGSAWEYVIDTLFFWQTDHCQDAYLSEKERKQLPQEYR